MSCEESIDGSSATRPKWTRPSYSASSLGYACSERTVAPRLRGSRSGRDRGEMRTDEATSGELSEGSLRRGGAGGAATPEQKSGAEDDRIVRVFAKLVQIQVRHPPTLAVPPRLKLRHRPHRPRGVDPVAERCLESLVAPASVARGVARQGAERASRERVNKGREQTVLVVSCSRTACAHSCKMDSRRRGDRRRTAALATATAPLSRRAPHPSPPPAAAHSRVAHTDVRWCAAATAGGVKGRRRGCGN